ncbi:MAG: hypothetical protein E7271_11300 [Lachnospiraceae bacterium]|jgi:hypothetical protein|nr:hypothetical protein [Lachnospiraceae bacterium]
MFDVQIDESYIVEQSGTSEGTQIKYKKDDYWYKLDSRGREGYCEYLVSKLLTFTNLEPWEYIVYEQGYINGKPGCRSKNYLCGDDEFITIYRMYYNEFGRNLAKITATMETMEERIDYVTRFVKESTGVDPTEYFRKVFTLDGITLNEDRHFNNLALIYCEGQYRCAPIFDNGVSLLTANQSVNWNFDIKENVKRVVAKPFSGSHRKMYEYFGKGFDVDYKGVIDWLENEPPSKERNVLIYQVEIINNNLQNS